RRAVQPLADRAQGAAGSHPRRLHLGARRHRRRPHHRRGREGRRGLLGPPGGRRHRKLVRLRHGPQLPPHPPAGSVRRENHRTRVIYREAGQFKTSYGADQAIFPIVQDRIIVALGLVAAFLVPPLFASEYWLQAVLIPFMIYALAALGLNLLTGYAGQLSLGTGGFMAVGAYA